MGRPRIAILLVVLLLTANIFAGCGGGEGTAEWHAEQGVKLNNQDRYEEAIQEFNKAIELDPNLAEAYSNRGDAYLNLGQLALAIQDYTEAIRLDTQYVEAYNNRAWSYKLQGKKTEALADFRKFISLTNNPQWIEMAKQQIEELSK